LVDRFGDMPKALRNLVWSIKLKIAAHNLFAEKVKTREKEVFLYFNNELGEEFYQAPTFGIIMSSVNQEPEHFSFKQGKNHLILKVKGFADFRGALDRIKELGHSHTPTASSKNA
jgi:transcription-repair coupling factor (superfamily II helicase)